MNSNSAPSGAREFAPASQPPVSVPPVSGLPMPASPSDGPASPVPVPASGAPASVIGGGGPSDPANAIRSQRVPLKTSPSFVEPGKPGAVIESPAYCQNAQSDHDAGMFGHAGGPPFHVTSHSG